MELNKLYLLDCMEGMKQFPDKYFELAIVDPPFGDADGKGCDKCSDKRGKYHRARTGGTWAEKYGKYMTEWDVAPPKEYFDELFRVSKTQIIWGGNYFDLPPTRCFIVWRKKQIPLEGFSMSPVEYAWTSLNENAAMCEFYSSGGAGREDRFHPTQKPVALYEWLLKNYAHKGDKILDTHVGSASSLIACYNMGFDFIGFEIDEDYFKAATKRLKQVMSQVRISDITEPEKIQMML